MDGYWEAQREIMNGCGGRNNILRRLLKLGCQHYNVCWVNEGVSFNFENAKIVCKNKNVLRAMETLNEIWESDRR